MKDSLSSGALTPGPCSLPTLLLLQSTCFFFVKLSQGFCVFTFQHIPLFSVLSAFTTFSSPKDIYLFSFEFHFFSFFSLSIFLVQTLDCFTQVSSLYSWVLDFIFVVYSKFGEESTFNFFKHLTGEAMPINHGAMGDPLDMTLYLELVLTHVKLH